MLTRARWVTAGAMAVAAAACSPQGRVFVNGSGGAGTGGAGTGAGTGGATTTTTTTGVTTCTPESDGSLCAALGKTCEQVSAMDNCGTLRMANCGTCGTAEACVANVCQVPACADLTFSATGTPITSVIETGVQNVPAAVTPSGLAMLVQRGGPCAPYTLFIADESAPGSLSYMMTAVPKLAGMNVSAEEQQTLTPDGLTIVATSNAGNAFFASTRTQLGLASFGTPGPGDYAMLTPAAGATLSAPALSADGLAFYYRVQGTTADGGTASSIYETVRASLTVPFPAGAPMPAPVQDYDYVTATSSDRMTLFVQKGFSMSALTRTSLTQPFANPNAPAAAPILPGFRTRPLSDCKTLVGTCQSGCSNEQICTYTAL